MSKIALHEKTEFWKENADVIQNISIGTGSCLRPGKLTILKERK